MTAATLSARSLVPAREQWRRRGRFAARLAGWIVAGFAAYPIAAANAGCIHTNQLWSCVDASGHSLQLYCIGSGVVLTCMDFSGGWILVAPHEVLSQITTATDGQVSSQLLAAEASRQGAIGTSITPPTVRATPNGVAGVVPKSPTTTRR